MVSSKLFNWCLWDGLGDFYTPCAPHTLTAMAIAELDREIDGIRAACYPS